jgi:hypothetical protein
MTSWPRTAQRVVLAREETTFGIFTASNFVPWDPITRKGYTPSRCRAYKANLICNVAFPGVLNCWDLGITDLRSGYSKKEERQAKATRAAGKKP